MPLRMEVGLGPRRHCVRWEPSPQKGAQQRHFLAHVYCGQTGGWIKMPLGTEAGLGPGHIVLHGTQLPHGKGHSSPPLSGPCLLWTKTAECIRIPLGTEVSLGPGDIVLHGDAAPSPSRRLLGRVAYSVCDVAWFSGSKVQWHSYF